MNGGWLGGMGREREGEEKGGFGGNRAFYPTSFECVGTVCVCGIQCTVLARSDM